jgi:hypothetical protein
LEITKAWRLKQRERFDYFLMGPIEAQDEALVAELGRDGYAAIRPFSVTYGKESRKLNLIWVQVR